MSHSMTHKQQVSYHTHILTALNRSPVRTINTWPTALSTRADKQDNPEHQISILAIYTVYICYFYSGLQAEPSLSPYYNSHSLDKPKYLTLVVQILNTNKGILCILFQSITVIAIQTTLKVERGHQAGQRVLVGVFVYSSIIKITYSVVWSQISQYALFSCICCNISSLPYQSANIRVYITTFVFIHTYQVAGPKTTNY